MHVPVFQVIHTKFTTRGPQITLLEEKTAEFSCIVRPCKELCDTENPQIELSPLYQQRIGDIFLDYKLSHIMRDIFTGCRLNELSDLIQIFEYLNPTSPVGVLAWLDYPNTLSFFLH
jgi:hypothetical protein